MYFRLPFLSGVPITRTRFGSVARALSTIREGIFTSALSPVMSSTLAPPS